MKMLRMSLLSGLALSSVASFGASALDDVVAYFRGGSGNAVAGSMPDLAHRNTADNPWSKGTYYNVDISSGTIRFEDDNVPLVSRHNGDGKPDVIDTWLENEPCLCIEPEVSTNAEGTASQTKGARWQLGHPAEYSKNWTGFSFVMRYRPLDPGLNRDQTKPAWVFCAGTDWKTEGFCIRERANTARTGGTVHVGTDSSLRDVGWAGWGFTYGNWYEIAVCGDDTTKKLLIGFHDMHAAGSGADWKWTEMNYPANFVHLSGSGANYELALGMQDFERAWRGHIHQIGIWDRKLTRDEVIDFFRDDIPHAKLVELGCAGAAAHAFAADGSADVTMTKADAYHWNELPSKFVKGKKVTIPFTVRDWQANLGQVVKLTPASGSAAGVLAVSVDGTVVDSLEVEAGKVASLYVPKTLFTTGDHTLTLERTDDGAGDLAFDRIRLGGSWQMGRANSSRDEFTSPGGARYNYFGESANWGGGIRMFSAHYTDTMAGQVESIFCHFNVDSDQVDNKFTYRMRVNGSGTPTVGLCLNGSAKTNVFKLASTAWKQIEQKLDPKELKAGENVLAVVDLTPQSEAGSGATWHYFNVDCQALEIGPKRKGLVVVFR